MYTVTIRDNFSDAITWALETFDKQSFLVDMDHSMRRYRLTFDSESAAALFALRWYS
jgi:hypothetical protein